MGRLLAAEADGVNGDVAVAQRRDRLDVDAAGVVGAVAQQHDRADGQIGGFVGQLLEAVADVRGRRGGLQLLEIGDAGQLGCRGDRGASETSFASAGERAVLERLDRLSLPRGSVFRDRHAARVVHQDGDDVLLRLQLGDRDRRLPQQERAAPRPARTEAARCAPARQFLEPDAIARQARAQSSTRGPAAATIRWQPQDPRRPGAEQDEVALGEDRARILEEKLEHEGVGQVPRRRAQWVMLYMT